ncbi:MAG TPA: hypothetical protein VJ798_04410 [Rhizomicrobium sp.]|nr:hypothetical protein [Rhizomicrobium sp.]
MQAILMASGKAQELRALLGLATKLRTFAETTDDLADAELFLSAALALEDRASMIAFDAGAVCPPEHQKVDVIC